jgi:hypothetical protein
MRSFAKPGQVQLLIPPLRIHRHLYAPHARLRAHAVAIGRGDARPEDAADEAAATSLAGPATLSPAALPPAPSAPPVPERPPSAAPLRWAQLLARILEVLPPLCPACGRPMRILAFLTDPPTAEAILHHQGAVSTSAIAIDRTRRATSPAKILSRSWSRKRGLVSYGNASRTCRAVQFSKNEREFWDGCLGRSGRYRRTVDSLTSIPSFCSSAWIRGAPHVGFELHMWRIRRRTDGSICGRRFATGCRTGRRR